MRAVMNGVIIAESDRTIVIESNHYFPPDAVEERYLVESTHRSICPWKGEAHYYHVDVDGVVSRNAAWTYPHPKKAAQQIAGYVAFWKDVQVIP